MDAFYEPSGRGRYRTLPAAAGPWGAAFQHGGPPSALLARAVERDTPARPDLRISRVTVDIMRPVPVAEVTTSARVIRGGRRSDLVAAELAVDGDVLVRLAARRIATEPASVPATAADPAPLLPPPGAAPAWPGADVDGYLSAVEWRFAAGSPGQPGPALAWARCGLDLVAGEGMSPVEHALVIADSASGVSAELDITAWAFANTDLTVVLHRPPQGGWLCLDAQTSLGDDGTACASARLWDERALVGHSLQTLAVSPRRRP